MFVVIGIGADGYFVMVDAFAQSGTIPGISESLEERMRYTCLRASFALLVTSFTASRGMCAPADCSAGPQIQRPPAAAALLLAGGRPLSTLGHSKLWHPDGTSHLLSLRADLRFILHDCHLPDHAHRCLWYLRRPADPRPLLPDHLLASHGSSTPLPAMACGEPFPLPDHPAGCPPCLSSMRGTTRTCPAAPASSPGSRGRISATASTPTGGPRWRRPLPPTAASKVPRPSPSVRNHQSGSSCKTGTAPSPTALCCAPGARRFLSE